MEYRYVWVLGCPSYFFCGYDFDNVGCYACEVAEISFKKFRQLIQVNPDILMRLSAQRASRLQVTSQKVGDLAFLDVTGRIAQTLLNLAKQPDAMTHPDGTNPCSARAGVRRCSTNNFAPVAITR